MDRKVEDIKRKERIELGLKVNKVRKYRMDRVYRMERKEENIERI